MSKTTYYSILSLDQNASKDEIKSSFRKLAKKYHPDKNQQSNEAKAIFIIISNAYQILINEKTKKEYDNYINLKRGSRTQYYKSQSINPIINKTLYEFNYILWDIDDLLKKLTIEDLNKKYNGKDLYKYFLDMFRYLEVEILNETYRFTNFKNKRKKEGLHLLNYFYLLRIEIDKFIVNIDLSAEKSANEIENLLKIKNKLIVNIGEITNYIGEIV